MYWEIEKIKELKGAWCKKSSCGSKSAPIEHGLLTGGQNQEND